MTRWLEVDDRGSLTVPPDVLGPVAAHRRYRVETSGEVVLLRPEEAEPFWARATPEERVAAFRAWLARHQGGPALPIEALRRISLYD